MKCIFRGIALTALLFPVLAYADTDKPNVLFLLADDMRADTIHALSQAPVDTPNLDRLAARGMAFSNAHIMGAHNAAVCMPSRAMLLTGQPLRAFDRNAGTIPKTQAIWLEQLRGAGYDTFITGKWHQDKASLNRAFGSGAGIFFGGMHDPFNIPLQEYDPTGGYAPGRARVAPGQHATNLLADTAITFLEGRSTDQPFVAYVSFTLPHDPRNAPAEYHQRYAAQAPPLPENFLPEHPFDNGELKIRDELLAAFPRSPEEVRRHLADYYATITHLDAQVGRILDSLEAAGLARKTLVVFTADNGLAIGSHGLMGKQNLYEHSVRVPLLIAGPGISAGTRSDALLYLNDLSPTLLECCGITASPHPFAQSFAPVLRGERSSHRELLVHAYKDNQRAIRRGDWKLITYEVAGVRQVQLFHLGRDPGETHNLASEPGHRDIVEELEGLLKENSAPLQHQPE